MHVGERIPFVPAALRYGNKTEARTDPVPGVVVWIHPEYRFAVVERRTAYYTYRGTVRLTRAERRMLNGSNEIYRNHEPKRRGRQDGDGA